MKHLLLFLNKYFASVPSALRPYRIIVLILALISTIVMAIGAAKFTLDVSIESWFDKDDPALEALDEFRGQFGSDDGIFLVYEAKDGDVFSHQSLTKIAEITALFEHPDRVEDSVWQEVFSLSSDKPDELLKQKIHELSHIKRVQSLTNVRIQQNIGNTLSAPLLVPRDIPTDQGLLNEIKLRANEQISLPLFMFSKDHRFGAISIQTDFGAIPLIESKGQDSALMLDDLDLTLDAFDASIDKQAFRQEIEFEELDPAVYISFIESLSAIYSQPHYLQHFDFYPVGNAAMIDLAWDTMIQAAALLIGMIIVINVVLWGLFRSFAAVIWPQLAIGLSVLFVIGGIGWFGVASTTLIALSAMLIVAVGVADCVHVMSSYLFFRRSGEEHEVAMSHAYGKTGVPILLTTITTMAGMMALTATGMPQFSLFGITSAVGVGLAFLYTLYLLPVLLDYWHPEPKKKSNQSSRIQSFLVRMPPFAERYRYLIVFVFVGVFVACLYGASKVKIDSNLVDLYSEDVPIHAAYDIVDEHMMGTGSMIIMVDLGESEAIMSPEILERMARLQRLVEVQYSEYIIRTSSLADLVKETHAIMQGSEVYRVIPDNAVTVSQLLYLFNSANPEERRALVSDDYSRAHISVQLKNAGSSEYTEFFESIQKDIDSIFADLKYRYPYMQVQITGSFALMMRLADDLSHNQFKSLALAAIVISALLMVTLGSLQAGAMSIIPNLIPATLAFGLMGLLDIPLDTDTLMIAPLIIGIAVDDTIHFISHYRMALVATNNMRLALVDTVKEVGQAVTFTTLILGCGFFMLSFSDYLGLAKIGAFGSMAIFVALLCDLLFFPALIMIFKPKFGEKNVDDNFNFSGEVK